jgi:carboxymethylenebutenolidase
MSATATNIRSRDGGEFSCYVALPETDNPVPAIVIASAVHGVDADIRAIADEFATHGFIAAAPDLFWRAWRGERKIISHLLTIIPRYIILAHPAQFTRGV